MSGQVHGAAKTYQTFRRAGATRRARLWPIAIRRVAPALPRQGSNPHHTCGRRLGGDWVTSARPARRLSRSRPLPQKQLLAGNERSTASKAL